MDKKIFQIIDANLNRTREGLRVCEDIARFMIPDKNCAKALKIIRHAATKALLDSKDLSLKKLLRSRDTKRDLLKFVDFKKQRNDGVADIFMSNIERVKESLRVLEECCKIIDENASRKYRRLRFNAYAVEKMAVGKIIGS
ncbi:thiamine-phosphate pyrophosphorylase [Candidatus Omnitrophota bacterium]